MNVENIAGLYQESLMIHQGQVTCTGISLLMEGSISHDTFTRLLSSGNLNLSSLRGCLKMV